MNAERNAPRIPGWLVPATGAVIWGIAAAVDGVDDLRGFAWSGTLLIFAALVVVPIVLGLVESQMRPGLSSRLVALARVAQLPAACCLVGSMAVEPGTLALLLAAPWIALTTVAALAGVAHLIEARPRGIAELCGAGGLIFFAIGGAWVGADRLGASPLGFGSDIVQLTAVHFHYAGLALPVLAGCVLREFPRSRLVSFAGFGVLAGVPLVALGITGTQLGWSHWIEVVAAAILGFAGILVASFQAGLATEPRWPRTSRLLWAVASLSLAFGMTLAVLYGFRSLVLPLPWLGIPWMRALHGTANAIGFCLCAAIGWRVANGRRNCAAA